MHRLFPLVVGLLFCRTLLLPATPLQVATFRCEVTPDPGEPLIWVVPALKIESPLWGKGVVLQEGSSRYVLCALDWCGVAGSTDRLFREKIAAAAGTPLSQVALQSVHQHSAPYIYGDAYGLLRQLKSPPLMMTNEFLQRVADRLAQNVRDALARLEPFDQIGTGQARVEQVASSRRNLREGKVIVRYSTGGTDPVLAALPEGFIDPWLKTITLASGGRPLVRLHYYASHPQTFCCDGRISGDFVGDAREALENEEKVFQIYFTGCAGDITVGKYNDTTLEARRALELRLGRGMKASIAATRFTPAVKLKWRHASFSPPLLKRADAPSGFSSSPLDLLSRLSGPEVYTKAISIVYAQNPPGLPASSLELGNTWILQLPGEPMLEFQRFAQGERPGEFVAVAGYGDLSPGYLCTDQAFTEGGYEITDTNVGPGTEESVKKVIRLLLGK
jgi:hypothetical protein